MSEARWVQHVSGQGERWQVNDDHDYNKEDRLDWCVINPQAKKQWDYHYLPKSEYRLCDPPERWEDVTAECMVNDGKWGGDVKHQDTLVAELQHGYRLRKVQYAVKWSIPDGETTGMRWAFIVERKVTG